MPANSEGNFFTPFILAIVCFSSMLTASGFADDAGESPVDSRRSLETVQVTATRSEQSIYAVSEAVTVIEIEAISRQAPELLSEMLRGVPGAFFQQTTPGQGIPIIRGLKGSQVLHLVDGMRLNNAFFRNAPNQYLGLVDAYITENLEVVRGSAPSLYGADAMGGVVQVLSAEPGFSGAQWQGEGRIYGSFNSVDNSFVTRAQAAAGRDGTALSGGLTYQDHSDRKVGDGGSGNGTGKASRGRFPDQSIMDSAALYASNEWHWDAMTLRAGLRYSRFKLFLPATAEVTAVRLKPVDLTGDIHFNYEIKPGLHLVSNVGRGFRPPNIFDLGTLGSRPGNRFNVPSTNLKPEFVWSYDLGVKSGGRSWEAELFLFYSNYQDKISSRFAGDLTPDGRFIVRSANLNKVQLWGMESGLRYLLNDTFELHAVLNYTRGEESDDAGMTVPADRIPPLSGRVGVTFEPGYGLRLEPYMDFAANQDRLSLRDASDPRINPAGTPGWATFNLLLSWQTSDELELGLRLENLADKNYREHGSGIDAPGRNLGIWFNLMF